MIRYSVMESDKVSGHTKSSSGLTLRLTSCAEKPWWPCVIAIAELIRSQTLDLSDESLLQRKILEHGFSAEDFDHALAWLQEIRLSGHFADVVSILSQDIPKDRAESPVETLFLPTQVWQRLTRLRNSGGLPVEMVELMVETSRQVDMRDWDEDSIQEFFEQLVLMLGGSEAQSRMVGAHSMQKNLLS